MCISAFEFIFISFVHMIIIIWGTDTGFPKWRVKSGEKKRKRRHETNIIYNKKKWKRNEYREGKKNTEATVRNICGWCTQTPRTIRGLSEVIEKFHCPIQFQFHQLVGCFFTSYILVCLGWLVNIFRMQSKRNGVVAVCAVNMENMS